MKIKRLLMLLGSACLALMLVLPLLSGCASSTDEEVPADFGCTLCGATGSWTTAIPASEKSQGKIPSNKKHCDIFFGQTMDNAWWPTRHTLFVIQPEDGYKYIGTKAHIWGLCTGVNEKGFGISGAYIGATDTPTPGGISKEEIGPLLLESCANVDEAIALLEETPRASDCWCRNMLMGDAEGNLALVEISYERINVETYTNDGYVVRTNCFTSEEMGDLDGCEDPFGCVRLQRGNEWFADVQTPFTVEDMFDCWAYIYEYRQDDTGSGPGTTFVVQPKELTYWFTYGWPGGNLPTEELELRQLNQNMTWGTFIPFYLPELPPGQYTTELGQLTPLGVQYVMSHFSSDLQSPPAWLKYQSEDPMKPFYKPAEDIVSPDGRAPKENPFGPGGMIGTWTRAEGFIPYIIPGP